MNDMFAFKSTFNSDISRWDISSVTNMDSMFYSASSFNSNISNWNVSSVTDMGYMFYGASSFNSDISRWDVSSVTNMRYMCSIRHQASIKSSVLGVPSCLQALIMLIMCVACFSALVASTRPVLQDVQDPGVL
jgi:surface protein